MKVPVSVRAATSDAADIVQRRLTLWAVVGVLSLTAFGFATAALFLALTEPLGTAGACVIVACGYAGLAVVIVLASRGREGPAQRTAADRLSDEDAIGHLVATFAAAYRAARD